MTARAEGPALLAYDGSEEAAAAIRRSASLLSGSRALVVHVWDSLSALLLHTDVSRLKGTMREAAEELDEEDRRQAKLIIEEGLEIAREAGWQAEGHGARGKPMAWPVIVDAAESTDAAVVVTGSRGLGCVSSALLGSISAGLLHHSRRPVLIVPPGPGDAPGAPIVAYDGSEHAREAIRAAARLLADRQIEIDTVWTPYSGAPGAETMGVPVAVVTRAAEQLDRRQRVTAAATAEEGARLAADEGLEASAEAVQAAGRVWRALTDRAALQQAKAIVVGSRGRSAVASALLGGVSTGVVHHASTPLLVVPPRD
jgi:nucleotide-binding universal stress UspA family protein